MIIFKELRWGNAFSYGPLNTIRLDANPLTQLVGKNGHGKSSIALILEEVLFNTNSKKIKKADVLNRHTKDKSYTIELDFVKDGDEYGIITTRTASTSTVKLFCNGNDCSSHTATGTYKEIERILGYDHKTFSQIVYQSSASSLEFLTATDTARKTFLIELLRLSVYTQASDIFKKLASEVSKKVDVQEGKLSNITSWIKKYEKEDLTPWTLREEIAYPAAIIAEAEAIQVQMNSSGDTNKRIEKNNTYKQMLASITLDPWTGTLPDPKLQLANKVELASLQKELKDGKALSAKGACKVTKCPTCSQDIDNSTHYSMAESIKANIPLIEARIKELENSIKAYDLVEAQYNKSVKNTQEWEKYHSLIDNTLPSELIDEEHLFKQFKSLKATIIDIQSKIDETQIANKKALDHNAKISVISEQLDAHRNDLVIQQADLDIMMDELSKLQVLVKAFSTTGLVAYKIECLVKDLEAITNEYLAELAGGRFQLSFQITSSDKLNVVITDNGRDIDITALSSGERARVNVATLLAIRKLMQTLSNSRTNLLILDETVENLDAEGKEKLVEVLLKEESLNTFLISHGFSHPLLEKLSIVKENNVSRIE